MTQVYYLTEQDIEIICEELENFFRQVKDPSPNYRDSYFEKLDSVLNIPKKTFDGKDLYDNIYKKAACYFYFINKLHPFNNGNKRMSVAKKR